MKRKILIMALALVMATLALASCNGDGGSTQSSGGNECVFAPGVLPSIVYSKDTPTSVTGPIYTALKNATGDIPDFYYDTDEEAQPHEIVIGNTSRSISRKAMRKLRLEQRNDEYDRAYLIYASGNSVAIVFDEEDGEEAAKLAAQYFVDTYITGKESAKFTPGVVYAGTYNVLDKLAEEDALKKEAQWKRLADAVNAAYPDDAEDLGEQMVEAFKSLYAIYDPEVVTWFANLYDPGVGGYYFSNSARDNVGFLPDIESTAQALGAISSLGLGSYRSFIPEDMRREIIIYLRGLQDENGFFYHTQWDKADTDAHLSRRARDLGNATGVLQNLGSKPRFNTPNGAMGGDGPDVIPDSIKKLMIEEGTLEASSFNSTLGQSAATAVSKVVLAAAYDPRFESLDTFKEYLQYKMDQYNSGATSFYAIGNELTSQMAQIINRDSDLGFNKKNGNFAAEGSLTHYVIQWFNARQESVQEERRKAGLEPNGLWDFESNYLGVNGLLKISGVYNKAEAPIPYAGAAAQAAIDAITSDQVMGAVVDLYNTWFSVGNVLSNLESYGGTAGKAEAAEIVKNLRAVAPAAIIKSGVKMHDFEKPDGSYSYGRLYSSTTSQGMPVSIPNSVEGDVNGTVIAINGLVGNIWSALRLSDVKVDIFGSREARVYYDILCDLDPVQKITEEAADDFMIDFEDEIEGEPPVNVNGGTNAIVCENKDGKYVELVSVKSTSASVTIPNNGVKANSCYTHMMDFCIPSGRSDAGYLYQITMGSCYMYSIRLEGGKVVLYEATTESGSTAIYTKLATVDLDTWHSVKVEYYAGADDDSVRIKFYFDGKLIAVTNNYYKKINGATTNTPIGNGSFNFTKVYAMQSPASVIWIDNVHSFSSKTYYTPATDADTDLVVNIDAGKSFGDGGAE